MPHALNNYDLAGLELDRGIRMDFGDAAAKGGTRGTPHVTTGEKFTGNSDYWAAVAQERREWELDQAKERG